MVLLEVNYLLLVLQKECVEYTEIWKKILCVTKIEFKWRSISNEVLHWQPYLSLSSYQWLDAVRIFIEISISIFFYYNKGLKWLSYKWLIVYNTRVHSNNLVTLLLNQKDLLKLVLWLAQCSRIVRYRFEWMKQAISNNKSIEIFSNFNSIFVSSVLNWIVVLSPYHQIKMNIIGNLY